MKRGTVLRKLRIREREAAASMEVAEAEFTLVRAGRWETVLATLLVEGDWPAIERTSTDTIYNLIQAKREVVDQVTDGTTAGRPQESVLAGLMERLLDKARGGSK